MVVVCLFVIVVDTFGGGGGGGGGRGGEGKGALTVTVSRCQDSIEVEAVVEVNFVDVSFRSVRLSL